MRNLLASIHQFLSELRRRNVYQVAVAYLAAGFVVVELADIAAGTFDLPRWFGPMVWVVVGLGFPIALVMDWALEVTPEGVRVEEPKGSEEMAPAPASSPRDLWVGASVLALLLLGVWWMWGSLGSGGAAEKTENRGPEVEKRSIAVLPFEVTGSGAETWRDGMVTMLSMNLDGAAGRSGMRCGGARKPNRKVIRRFGPGTVASKLESRASSRRLRISSRSRSRERVRFGK